MQQFNEKDLSWLTPSVLRHVARNLTMMILLGAIAFLALQYLRGRLGPVWIKVYAVVTILLVCIITIGYVFWWQTGIDY